MIRKRPKIKPGTPVVVHWFDAHEKSSQTGSAEELIDTNCELIDIGFYVGTKGKFLTIAVEKDRDEPLHFRHTHHIPCVNIISVTTLSDGEEIKYEKPSRRRTSKNKSNEPANTQLPDKGCKGSEQGPDKAQS